MWILSEAWLDQLETLGTISLNAFEWDPAAAQDFMDRRMDLKGLQLKVAYQKSPVYQDFLQAQGYNFEIFKQLQEWLNFTFSAYIPVNDTSYGSMMSDNISFNGLIGQVQQGVADIAVADLTITEDRRKAVEFIYPVKEIYKALLIQRPGETSALGSYVRVISPSAWMALILYFLSMSLTFTFLFTNWRQQFPLKVLKALAIMAQHVARPEKTYESHWVHSKMLTMVALLSGFLIFAHYNALLTSFLTVNNVEMPIQSLDDLLHHPSLKLSVNKDTALEQIMGSAPESSILRRLFEKKVTGHEFGSIVTYDENRQLTKVSYEALAQDYAIESSDYHLADPLFTEYPCKITDVPKVKLFTELYAYALPKNSPVLKILNLGLKRMDETGLIDRFHRKYFDRPQRQSCDDAREFGLAESSTLFIILSIGIGLSLGISLVERLHKMIPARGDILDKPTTILSWHLETRPARARVITFHR
eukprot:TCALIF_13084-PA protein Name:"Similar to GRIA2 Glutamate receptor 2 (Homo sapiens)" AED:0.21 eAED:0.25 QI:0/-1/0/1/-1/1/1/0/474